MPEGDQLLIVDDVVALRDLYADFLTRVGFQVRTAGDGQEALRLLRTRSVDLIILDLEMPGMNGLDFRRQQQATPPIADIPVLGISWYPDESDVADSVQAAAALS